VENYLDFVQASTRRNGRRARRVRAVVIPDALVDTGTTRLCLPARYIRQLGLRAYPGRLSAQTASGHVKRRLFGGALLTIQGRTEQCSVVEVPDSVPALIGVMPLEALDFIVDPTQEKIVGKHGDKQVLMLF
jgi:predicted aspartyl protease